MKLLTACVACAAVATVSARHCGTEEPSAALGVQYAEAEQRWTSDPSFASFGTETTIVNTYVHVVTNETAKDYWTQAQIDEQMIVMNRAYEPHGFKFRLLNTSWTVNEDWAGLKEGLHGTEMKSALRQGTYADLNLYFLSSLSESLLGFCFFPESNITSEVFIKDGCVNAASSLPNGGYENFELGATAVHEVGHWFGLFHVFQGYTCSNYGGDWVDDTPNQKWPTDGCPRDNVPDTCPDSPGKDSIFNWMDYSYDECMDEFTPGQGVRMRTNYKDMRGGQ